MMFEAKRKVEYHGKIFNAGDSIISFNPDIVPLMKLGFVRKMNTFECVNAIRQFRKWCEDNDVNFYDANRMLWHEG